ncbi:MAG: hypothetical protein AAGF11_03995 [Myxococcota bacterium]
MEFSRFTSWIGLTGLVVALAGCPGDDSNGDTMANPTTMDPTTTTNPTTGTDPTTSGSGADSTTGGGESSSTGAMCDPPCEAGEVCVEGICLMEVGESSSSGGEESSSSGAPPAMCGLGVNLMFPTAMCGECAEAMCCMELQACFGDETVMEPTACTQLNACINTNCGEAATLPALQMCVDENCAETADALNGFLGYVNCVGTSCAAACS